MMYTEVDNNCIFSDDIECKQINCHLCPIYAEKVKFSARMDTIKGTQISMQEYLNGTEVRTLSTNKDR